MIENSNISDLIKILGGTGKVAKALNINSSAISNWKKNNLIPKIRQNDIDNLAKNLNINIEKYKVNNQHSVLLIICGGIAAYKSLEIIRSLKALKVDLDVVLTQSAQKFITPLLVSSLNQKKCFTDLFSIEDEMKMNHISLARKPKLILIAPATGNILAKLAHGFADDLASTILLASNSQILIAPSMNPIMWENQATKANYKTLLDRGIRFIEPETGDMACGENGKGRLASPFVIINKVMSYLSCFSKIDKENLKDVSIIVTAGPTLENIDPVRYISNYSSGKQGFAIATELERRGALVTLITGPVNIPIPKVSKLIQVKSAQEMYNQTISNLPVKVIICAAAVADWRLVPQSLNSNNFNINNKIKKISNLSKHSNLMFKTIKNPDILAQVAIHSKRPDIVIGFAAETDNILNYAKEKLISKKADLILANDVSYKSKVFGGDYNSILVVEKDHIEEWKKQDKISIANKLASKINLMLSKKAKFMKLKKIN